MGHEIQLAGIRFSTEDWRAYDDETRAVLLAAATSDDAGDFGDEEPTLIRTPMRAGA